MDPLLTYKQLHLLSKSYPYSLENLIEYIENSPNDALEELQKWLEKYGSLVGIPVQEIQHDGEKLAFLCDFILMNKEIITNPKSKITADDIKVPQFKDMSVNWDQDYREWGKVGGEVTYQGSSKDSVERQVWFDVESGGFDWDSETDRESHDYETDDFDFNVYEQDLKKVIHKVLTEQHKLFIKKQN